MPKNPDALNEIIRGHDRFLAECEEAFRRARVRVLGCTPEETNHRLRQAIWGEFWQELNRNYDPATGKTRARFEPRGGKVRVDFRTALRYARIFLKNWLLVLVRMLRAYGKRAAPGGAGPYTVVLCFGHERSVSRTESFAAFCSRGPIPTLRDAKARVLAACKLPEDLAPSRPFLVSAHPWHAILALHRPRFAVFLRLLLSHAALLPAYFRASLRSRACLLLGVDFSLQALLTHLNRERRIAHVVYDNTAILHQPLPLSRLPGRAFDTGILFYSINNKPFQWIGQKEALAWPTYRFLTADAAWAWDQDQFDWLRENTPIPRIEIVGPTVYSVPAPARTRRSGAEKEFRILIFDVIPNEPSHFEEVHGKLVPAFLTDETAIGILRGVIDAARALTASPGGRPVVPYLKQKRKPIPGHSWGYIDFLQSRFDSGELFEAPMDAELYSLISDFDLVVSTPFSSPNFVAEQIGVPSIYYDPTGHLFCNFKMRGRMEFVQGADALLRRIQALSSASDQTR